MGNSASQKAAEKAKHRRYSRSSGFAHWMDNIRDKKQLKISMKQTSDLQGTFSLVYVDESMDDFFNVKSTFTFTGTYQHVKGEDVRDLFGVVLPLTSKGTVGGEDADKSPGERISAAMGAQRTSATLNSEKDGSERETCKTTVKLTRFFTEKLTCKLTEGDCTQNWVLVQSTVPDCIEARASEIQTRVSWPWSGVNGAKMSHKAPPGTLDFIGEENFESNGSSSLDLKMRFPQLAAAQNPAVVVLNEMGGWKLGKKPLIGG